MKNFIIFIVMMIAMSCISRAQIAINTTGADPNSSAMLDVSSETKGFLPPRMTVIERDQIQNPTAGLIIYNTESQSVDYYNGVGWVELSDQSAPLANFLATPATGIATLTTSFTDLSTNSPTSWMWDFGDGETSTDHNPTHVFNNPGMYTVSLTVSNASGTDNEIKTHFIVVEYLGGGVPCPGTPTVTDCDVNVYNTVLIGNQCWMKESLKVTHYPNGDDIPYITDNSAWGALDPSSVDDAYCYYENNTSSEYGALYTYAAAIADNWQRDNADDQGICPDGWHLPTDAEWTTLTNFLGGESIAGLKMKEAGTAHWESPNAAATNESGFTALPCGFRSSPDGWFYCVGEFGNWWLATESSSSDAWYRYIMYSFDNLSSNSCIKTYGHAVRCLRD